MNKCINEYQHTFNLPGNNNDMVNKLGATLVENNAFFQNIRKNGNNNQAIGMVGETHIGSTRKIDKADKNNTTKSDSRNNPELLDQSSSYTTGIESALTNNDGAQPTTLLGE